MKSCCLKCRKNTENINPKVVKTSTGRTMVSKCVICSSKKSSFNKNQELPLVQLCNSPGIPFLPYFTSKYKYMIKKNSIIKQKQVKSNY